MSEAVAEQLATWRAHATKHSAATAESPALKRAVAERASFARQNRK